MNLILCEGYRLFEKGFKSIMFENYVPSIETYIAISIVFSLNEAKLDTHIVFLQAYLYLVC